MGDDDGTQDQAANYNKEGQEGAANNEGIRHQTEKTMLFLAGVVQFFAVSTICCFWRGSYDLCVYGVLLTKEKVVHTTPCTTYVEKKQPKHPQHHVFLGE